MTTTDIDSTAYEPVTAATVPDDQRLAMLPQFFGTYFVRAEALVFLWMGTLCRDYSGGFWSFHRRSNDGFFMAPSGYDKVVIEVATNDYSGEMSPQAAGITACLFTFDQLANSHGREQERFLVLYDHLRDFVDFHPEVAEICRAID